MKSMIFAFLFLFSILLSRTVQADIVRAIANVVQARAAVGKMKIIQPALSPSISVHCSPLLLCFFLLV